MRIKIPAGVLAALLAGVLVAAWVTPAALDAALNRPDRWRIERGSKHFGPAWSAPKLRANFRFRVPVEDALGFLALRYGDDARTFAAARARLVAVAAARDSLLATTEMRGAKFQKSVVDNLAALRSDLLAAVRDTYGEAIRQQLSAHLNGRVDTFRRGVLVGSVHF